MKSKLERIITYGLFLLVLTGCTKEEQSIEQNKTNDECCQGCLCGDTIELLSDTETAWTLTKINDEGEPYSRTSLVAPSAISISTVL